MTIDTTKTTTGRVIASYGAECLVETIDQARLPCQSTRKVGRTVCGDQVRLAQDVHGGRLLEILPRKNEFLRADRRGGKRIVAANLDRIIIVVAPRPEPTRDLINRYLVACEMVYVPPVICLNKFDLLNEENQAAWKNRQLLYQQLGYEFVFCSTKTVGGMLDLMDRIASGASIMVGQSGVGKSSIIQALIPDLDLRTRGISSSTGKGRHTTTVTTLYHCPDGGDLIDSPGVWEYGIWNMSPQEIGQGFVEFRQWAGQCRFDNCIHTVEPGCAIAAAAASAQIDPSRLDSYRRIVEAVKRSP